MALYALLLVAANLVSAPDPCPGTTQLEMNACAAQRFDAADQRLNGLYREARACIDGKAADGLKRAQRAWLAFRDTECAWQADQYKGGSIQPLVLFGCRAELTQQRADALQGIVDDVHARLDCDAAGG